MSSFTSFHPFMVAVLVTAATAVPVAAIQSGPPSDTLTVIPLDPIDVVGRAADLIGRVSTGSTGYVGFRDLARRPLTREGELLEVVPGMILTQHSGSGKSNQMFVRGFNLDHGTDFATRVEGMPVNIPSHAHGQGYTDLNFLIPELVDHVEYSLGTSSAQVGDFGSAGGAHIRIRRELERPFVQTGFGQHGHRRLVAAGSLPVGGSGTLLAAGELRGYDGPWEIPEDVRKLSGLMRYSVGRDENRFSLLVMAYDNEWRASDQIPRRAVSSGLIDRFGQIDETLGGASSRASLSAEWSRLGARSSQRVQAYAIRYSLDLFSNFTYRLEDAEAGDQFRQEDDGRTTAGVTLAHRQLTELAGRDHHWTVGAETRVDIADVTLSRTRAREPVSVVRSDEIDQVGTGLYGEVESRWTDRFRTTLGLRADLFHFDVVSELEANTGSTSDAIVSPKLGLALRAGEDTELYLSGGLGFHSNDARGTVTTIDPATGEPAEPVDPLVRSSGGEVGLRTSFLDGTRSTVTLWTVDLDSELLFVGDAGTTEASEASRRVGITLANFWRLGEAWTADLDVSLIRARFRGVGPGVDRVPGALEDVVAAGIGREPPGDGAYGGLRLRRFGSYPLVEDNSVRADASSLLNLQLGYRFGGLRFGVEVFNLLDEAHSDVQYYYASRLAGEPEGGVEDLHFHPAEPRHLRVVLRWGC